MLFLKPGAVWPLTLLGLSVLAIKWQYIKLTNISVSDAFASKVSCPLNTLGHDVSQKPNVPYPTWQTISTPCAQGIKVNSACFAWWDVCLHVTLQNNENIIMW